MLSTASIFLSLVGVYFCRSGRNFTTSLKEESLNDVGVNQMFYKFNKTDGLSLLSLDKQKQAKLEHRKYSFYFYKALQTYKSRLKLRRRYLELLKQVNISENITLGNWHRRCLDRKGNIRSECLDSKLSLRAQQLIVRSGNTFLSFISRPLIELWHLLKPEILTDDVMQIGRNSYLNNSTTSPQKVITQADLRRLERSVEGGVQRKLEIDSGEEIIDAELTVHPFPSGKEDTSLVTYVYIPTTYIGCYRRSVPVSGVFSLVAEPTMSVDGCIYFCRDRRKTYAALHNGRDCICYSYVLQKDKTDEKSCDEICISNYQQICGGLVALSIFTTCNLYFYGYSCTQTCFCADGQCDFYTGICPSDRCKENWKGLRCDRHAFLDVSLETACWTGLIIYFGGFLVIIGFSGWTLVHMRLTFDRPQLIIHKSF